LEALTNVSASSALYGVPSATVFERKGAVPTVYSYSFGIQRSLMWGTILDVAYVGNLGRHLDQNRNVNPIPYGLLFTPAAQDPSRFAGGVVPSVEPNLPASLAAAGAKFSGLYALPDDFLRQYYGYGTLTFRDFDGSSNFNSLQVTLNRRLSKSLVFGAAYTFSKTLGTAFDDHSGSTSAYDVRGHDYRVADWDRKHTFVVNYVYTLPDFGRKVGGGRLARLALSDWQFSGVSLYYTGTPYELGVSIAGAGGYLITGSSSEPPRLLLNSNPAAGAPAGMQINPNAFVVPPIGSQGYGSRMYMRNPNFINHDVSVFKNFRYSSVEGRYVQFRLEMFNAPNNTRFSGVNSGTNITAPNGATGAAAFSSNPASLKITDNLRPAGSTAPLGQYFGEYSAAASARVIQLGLKIYF
jgi:hypothetical protein